MDGVRVAGARKGISIAVTVMVGLCCQFQLGAPFPGHFLYQQPAYHSDFHGGRIPGARLSGRDTGSGNDRRSRSRSLLFLSYYVAPGRLEPIEAIFLMLNRFVCRFFKSIYPRPQSVRESVKGVRLPDDVHQHLFLSHRHGFTFIIHQRDRDIPIALDALPMLPPNRYFS